MSKIQLSLSSRCTQASNLYHIVALVDVGMQQSVGGMDGRLPMLPGRRRWLAALRENIRNANARDAVIEAHRSASIPVSLILMIPAKAGIHLGSMNMDSRMRENDEPQHAAPPREVRLPTRESRPSSMRLENGKPEAKPSRPVVGFGTLG